MSGWLEGVQVLSVPIQQISTEDWSAQLSTEDWSAAPTAGHWMVISYSADVNKKKEGGGKERF